jgi:hypothetical protein
MRGLKKCGARRRRSGRQIEVSMREMGTVRGIDMQRGGGRNRMCVDDVGHGGVQVGASSSSLEMGVLKYMTMPLSAWAWCSKGGSLVL